MGGNDTSTLGPWLIYGANGYTGRLCVARALEVGLRPTLAGRNESEVRTLARSHGLPWCSFSLGEPAMQRALERHRAVLHCAGPYSETSEPMFTACLRTRTDYLDITGEIDVLESILTRHDRARSSGIVALSGVGFDVVPTDCLAVSLAQHLPGADELELAFAGGAGWSAGTLKTALEGATHGVRARRNGRIVTLETPPKVTASFRDRAREVAALGWGDVSSAFHSTGIPNITCYAPQGGATGKLDASALKSGQGPDEQARKRARMHLWGRVRRHGGAWVSGALDVPEGYTLTAMTALECVREVLSGSVRPGAWTPSQAFGADFITRFPGVERVVPLPSG